MIFSQLLNLRLFCGIILRSDDLIHPPFITGSGTQHAAHEMVMSVCVGKGRQGIVPGSDAHLDVDKRQGLSGAVYTQLSDVEEEVNGLVTDDLRIVKLPVGHPCAAPSSFAAPYSHGNKPE